MTNSAKSTHFSIFHYQNGIPISPLSEWKFSGEGFSLYKGDAQTCQISSSEDPKLLTTFEEEKKTSTSTMLSMRFKKILKSELLGVLHSGKVDKYLVYHEEANKLILVNTTDKKAYEAVGRTGFQCGNASKDGFYVRDDNNLGDGIILLVDEEMAAKF